ncbi:ATP-binding protein [Actinotignum sanguinis]|uniref:ATP-binding protein n=3 Tax=Actinomycetaceae TaxID=2049 RepID=A0ABZ0RCV7_9ACTO|nr:ATP-binding protein [Actinotignum sanguinis]WPJ88835.1 ATP-binding protein [Schaalia turicensis]MDE1553414.1 ATP-binding protein [Actinotignum sanguinis]MDE1564906.1 ATP-binding protein [Actinotignum sanguinis]MDE1576649.1 ATP-binding protein [Actinotignum sanguinis]MDE1656458.1 ATP-binding protein [Actinotignum sanguinis]
MKPWTSFFACQKTSGMNETNKGDCFQRIGDETRKLTFRQRQELEWDRGFVGFDGAPVPGGQLDDLDREQLEAYRALLSSSSGTNALRARDLIDRDGQLRVAGYLLFAKNPQQVFPNAYVRVVKYSDNERGAGRFQNVEAGKDIRVGGSLPRQIADASRIIEEFLPGHRRLTDAGIFANVPIIPREAWLEGLVNAVVHRSYGIAGDHIRVEIFPNRIEFTSPGRFPGLVDISHPERIGRNARNPRIARVFFDMGITQELGEGIRRIFEETRRAGLAEPLYAQLPEAVRLTLLASNAIPEEIMRQIGPSGRAILDALRLAQQPLGTGQITELVELARPTVLRHLNMLRDAGVIRWNGKSPRDPRATWELL